jgi:dsDNA-specific endonuclease/ATPase MutS2
MGKNSNKSEQKLPTLDLHGFKTDEVFDAVEKFLSQNTNKKQVRIMPGKGSGKVKGQVIEYLRLANYPWSFERMPNGQNNEGVMVVHMA